MDKEKTRNHEARKGNDKNKMQQSDEKEVQQKKGEVKSKQDHNEHNKEKEDQKEIGVKTRTTLKKRLNKISKKKKKKKPKKRNKVKIRIGKERMEEIDSRDIQEINTESKEQRGIEEDYSEGEIETRNAKNEMDQQQQETDEQVKLTDEERQEQVDIHKEGTGDNIKTNVIDDDDVESSSLPSVIKNHPDINLVVDLNDNMLETYRSQKRMDIIFEKDNTINNKMEEWKENKNMSNLKIKVMHNNI
ncbi:uncharacterized protein LOC132044638 [Lycium ferocissimum]|uniref:uncharacterized protein LOC132044638 n=1 Tax=Lycium ferocissimum TaxID=112874 RepID=UPI0028163DFA|nr:uncharacterized protein LOC132044638 [Lycium ferocissimum]